MLFRSARLTELLKQAQYSPMSVAQQVLSLFAANNGFLKTVSVENIKEFEAGLHTYFDDNHSDIVATLNIGDKIGDELSNSMKEAISKYLATFKLLAD